MAVGALGSLTLSVNANNPSFLALSSGDQTRSSHLRRLPVFFVTLLTLLLSACVAPLAALGGSSAAAASSAGSAAATAAMADPSTAISLASTATTGKSPLEHAASAATKKDCNFLNALGAKPICIDVPIPKITDYSESYLGPADTVTNPRQ